MAFQDNIEHRSKRVPWGGTTTEGDYVELGVDWSSAAFLMTFAAAEGGSALITLTNQPAGTEGISATYDAGYVHPETGEVVGATIIRPYIVEATFEALTWGADASKPLTLAYDLLITPSGDLQRVYSYGLFTIYPGVGD